MTDSKGPLKTDTGYFEIDSKDLKVGDPLPVDCYAFLEKNQKYLMWAKKGDEFTEAKKEKLQKLGFPKVFGTMAQRAEYFAYLERVSNDGATIKEKDTERKAGADLAVPTKVEAKARELGHKIFGTVNFREKEELIFVKSRAKDKPVPQKSNVAPKVKVSVDFVNSVIAATQNVFQNQFSNPIKFKTVAKRNVDTVNSMPIDVASFMVLATQTIRGTIGLCFPASTYLFLLRNATESAYSELIPELCIGACEFLFHIFENASPGLAELGYSVDRAIPTLVVGENLSLAHIIPDNGFSIVFETPAGDFRLEIGIKTGA